MFSTLCTNNNIKKIWFCVVSIFDYHKKKSTPSLRLHCVCGGRSYGSFIFQKHFELTLNLLIILKNNCFTISHQSPWLTRSSLFPSKLWVPTNFHTGSLVLYYQDILDILELWKQAGWRNVSPILCIIKLCIMYEDKFI